MFHKLEFDCKWPEQLSYACIPFQLGRFAVTNYFSIIEIRKSKIKANS